MKYETALKGLEFYGYHGLYEEEKILGGKFRVDVKVTTELTKPIHTLDEAVNYEILYTIAKEEMSARQDLIETVAQHIFSRVRNHFGEHCFIEVTIHKPNPAGVFKSGEASVTFTG